MMDVSDCGGRQAYRLSIRTRLPLSSGPVAFSAASAPMPMYSPARPAARLPRLPRTRECRAGMCSPREGGEEDSGLLSVFLPKEGGTEREEQVGQSEHKGKARQTIRDRLPVVSILYRQRRTAAHTARTHSRDCYTPGAGNEFHAARAIWTKRSTPVLFEHLASASRTLTQPCAATLPKERPP